MAESPDKSSTAGDDKAVLARARERFEYAEEIDGDNRKAALEDTKFVYERGAQWDQRTRARRDKWKLPSLEFNQLKQFVSQVINDQRQGRPGVKFSAAGSDASEKVAELKQELVRGIEVKSDAEAAYDTGFQHAVVGGRGFWRISADYESRKSFNQCLRVDRLPDPQSVRIDPDYQKADASDIKWGFVVEPIRKADYERLYGEHPLSWTPSADTTLWYPSSDSETVFVADYYEIIEAEDDLVLLDSGQALWANEVEEWRAAGKLDPAAKVLKTRKATRTRCDWYTLGGGEQIIEKHAWKGTFVPIVVCAGDEIVIDGKRIYQGLIRHAREPQQLLNYGMTQMAVRLSLTPKAPYMAPVAAIKGYERLYETSNEEDYAVLPYHHVGADGNPIPQPQRQMGSDIDAGWANLVQQMQGQIRSTIGMYENSLGMRAQETSGRAILARERQGDNATFHYLDNLKRAIAHTGRILDDLIPHYYDTERLVSLIERDGTVKMAKVNEQVPVPNPEQDGAVMFVANPDNDLTRGEYAVTVDSGPSHSTQKEATREALLALFQAQPQSVALLGDKLMEVMDLPDAKDLAQRFKLMLPPAVQQMEQAKEAGQRPPDPQMMQQLQQMQEQMQQATQAVQQLQAENQQLKQEQQVKMAEVQSDAQVALQEASIKAKTTVDAKLIDVAGNLLAEHMGLRTKAAIGGQPAPPPVGMGEIVQGLQGTVEQVRQSAEQGTPMPVPEMRMPPTGPSPDAVVILEGVNQIVGRMVEALTAPRAMQVQTDAAGNVIGGMSVPVTMQ